MEFAILIWILCGIAAAFIASSRRANGCLWFGLGILFGPFGLAFSFASGSGRKCPACQKHIHEKATRCSHCQADLTPNENRPSTSATVETPTKTCPFCAETIMA